MSNIHPLSRLAQDLRPSADQQHRIALRIERRIRPAALVGSAQSVVPDAEVHRRIFGMISRRMHMPLFEGLQLLRDRYTPTAQIRAAIFRRLSSHMQSPRRLFIHATIKWSAAFAVFLLCVRLVPLAFIVPPINAETTVQLVPDAGGVSVVVAGLSTTVTQGREIKGMATIQTHDDGATLYLHDDGVLRLAPHTVVRLFDIADRPEVSAGPTFVLVSGNVWVFGLVPSVFQGIVAQFDAVNVEINEGSVSLHRDAQSSSVSVYDRGVIVERGTQRLFVAPGNVVPLRRNVIGVPHALSRSSFLLPWVVKNLTSDSAYRKEVLKLQTERNRQNAGILPTSYLYPAKLAAEKVDLLFTLNRDARTQKQLDQAHTRFSEAATLLSDDQIQEAAIPLSAYRQTLLELATGSGGDNLVSYLINKQISDASAAIAAATSDTKLYALKQAVLDVSIEIPNTQLTSRDVQTYVLNDKLIALNQRLAATKDLRVALDVYKDLQPYIATLQTHDSHGDSALYQETQALLLKTYSLLSELDTNQKEVADDTSTVLADIRRYIPREPELQKQVLVTEQELDDRVKMIVGRSMLFRHPQSRENQLTQDLLGIQGDMNEASLLRRLLRSLPGGLQPLVRTRLDQLIQEKNLRV